MKNRILEIIEGVNGQLSSKRALGIFGSLVCIGLLIYFVIKATENKEYSLASSLITSSLAFFVGLLAGGSLGEHYFNNKTNLPDGTKQS